jgi:hypothetical protein
MLCTVLDGCGQEKSTPAAEEDRSAVELSLSLVTASPLTNLCQAAQRRVRPAKSRQRRRRVGVSMYSRPF